jgi:hypothetical protein
VGTVVTISRVVVDVVVPHAVVPEPWLAIAVTAGTAAKAAEAVSRAMKRYRRTLDLLAGV